MPKKVQGTLSVAVGITLLVVGILGLSGAIRLAPTHSLQMKISGYSFVAPGIILTVLGALRLNSK